MLSMGFEPDIRALAAALNKDDLQTMLFTATWPKAVQAVAFDLLKPTKVKITVGSGGTKLTANTAIKQVVTVVSEQNKWQKFLECMDDFRPHGPLQNQKVIVFCNTKKDVSRISNHFEQDGVEVDYLSGDRDQKDREKVLKKFGRGQITMVIATDVAARGLDIPGVEHVINYDFPKDTIGDYIHRIGRTGRADATGHALTLFTPDDARFARELVRILRDANQEVSQELEDLINNCDAAHAGKGSKGKGGKGKGGKGKGGKRKGSKGKSGKGKGGKGKSGKGKGGKGKKQ